MRCRWTVRVSGYLDGELPPGEREEFERHLGSCPACSEELHVLKGQKEVFAHMKLGEFPDEVWDRYRNGVWQRTERAIGWIFLSLGAMILIAAGIYGLAQALLHESGEPWWIRLGTACVSLGIAVLFVSVLRDRLFQRKRDRYREVER